MSKSLFRTLGPVNLGLTAAFEGPEAVGHTKRYIAQQRSGQKKVNAPVPPGGVPNMSKISAHQALRYYLRKQAAIPGGWGSAARNLPGALALGAGVAAGGLLAASGGRGVGNVYQRFQAQSMFKTLTQRYPEIRRHPKAREYFDMIVAYAPSLMRHPTAIGDFLRRQLEYPMSSVEFIKQLADLEGTVAKTEASTLSAQFGKDVAKSTSGFVVPLSQE